MARKPPSGIDPGLPEVAHTVSIFATENRGGTTALTALLGRFAACDGARRPFPGGPGTLWVTYGPWNRPRSTIQALPRATAWRKTGLCGRGVAIATARQGASPSSVRPVITKLLRLPDDGFGARRSGDRCGVSCGHPQGWLGHAFVDEPAYSARCMELANACNRGAWEFRGANSRRMIPAGRDFSREPFCGLPAPS